MRKPGFDPTRQPQMPPQQRIYSQMGLPPQEKIECKFWLAAFWELTKCHFATIHSDVPQQGSYSLTLQ